MLHAQYLKNILKFKIENIFFLFHTPFYYYSIAGYLKQLQNIFNFFKCFFFKFHLKVGVEESIVNAPLVNLQSKKKTQTTQKVGLDLNS
jgi:hypothetical protein